MTEQLVVDRERRDDSAFLADTFRIVLAAGALLGTIFCAPSRAQECFGDCNRDGKCMRAIPASGVHARMRTPGESLGLPWITCAGPACAKDCADDSRLLPWQLPCSARDTGGGQPLAPGATEMDESLHTAAPRRCDGRGRNGATYIRREPERSVLHVVVREHMETFLAEAKARGGGDGVPGFVERELREYLSCGAMARGFARFRC